MSKRPDRDVNGDMTDEGGPDELELEVGAETVTPGRTITEADLVSFAALTGDWHPQHADAEWAAKGRFGGRVAHGMLVISYAVGMVPFDPERVVALRGFKSISFKRPVRIGDTIRVSTKIEANRPLEGEHALVTMAWRVLNQEGRVVARAKVEALCRPEGAGAPGADGTEVDGKAFDGSIFGGPVEEVHELYGDWLSL